MTITTLSSREFNQDASRAKKATKDGPVFITDSGRPAHVLFSIEEYRRLTGQRRRSPIYWLCPASKISGSKFHGRVISRARVTLTDVPFRQPTSSRNCERSDPETAIGTCQPGPTASMRPTSHESIKMAG
jgi:prevent-host-death family protein